MYATEGMGSFPGLPPGGKNFQKWSLSWVLRVERVSLSSGNKNLKYNLWTWNTFSMELHGKLKTIGMLARLIEDIRTIEKKKPDKKFITCEAMKQGLTEELLSSLLDDLVSGGMLYVENWSHFVSKTYNDDTNEEEGDEKGEEFSTRKEGNKTVKQIDKESNTESVFTEKSTSPKSTTPTQHSECFAMKYSAVNATLPDLRIFESASWLAASVADLNQLIEREREVNRKITEENFTLRYQLDQINKSKDQILNNHNNGKVEGINKTPIVYESIEVETLKQTRRKKKKSKKRSNNGASTNTDSSDNQCHTESQTSAIPEEISSVTVKDKDEQQHKQDKQEARRNIVILGDSLEKKVEGWRMTKSCEKNEKIHVKAFSGATVNDMKHYCQPTVESSPDAVILHIGTNNLQNKNQSEVTLAQEIISLATSIEKEQIDVTISGLVDGTTNMKKKGKG